MPAVATLRDLAAAAEQDPNDVIRHIVNRLDDDDEARFLHGLAERVLAAHEPDGVFELHRWIGSWLLSLDLADDPHFRATDDEANKLLAAGKLGDGLTGTELRQRYGR